VSAYIRDYLYACTYDPNTYIQYSTPVRGYVACTCAYECLLYGVFFFICIARPTQYEFRVYFRRVRVADTKRIRTARAPTPHARTTPRNDRITIILYYYYCCCYFAKYSTPKSGVARTRAPASRLRGRRRRTRYFKILNLYII